MKTSALAALLILLLTPEWVSSHTTPATYQQGTSVAKFTRDDAACSETIIRTHAQVRDAATPQSTRIGHLPAEVTVTPQATLIVFLSGRDAAIPVDWEFFCTDGRNSGRWTTIPVPSNWELQGFGTYNYGHDWRDNNKKLGQEEGWYRHRFDVPAAWRCFRTCRAASGSLMYTDGHQAYRRKVTCRGGDNRKVACR